MEARTSTVFREIHKNTWLKRLSMDNKKKSERSWVVFCVHDDCEAMLEGYAEPRQAASHTPEWTVPLQHALHVSHALVPSEHEYEFVITLPAEVVRFNAASWEIMQEWVDTLRQKLREMKIMSPKENLYSKLPEIRAPLLPTRDPQSPLPAPPPVPAALVPGIERIVPSSAAAAAPVAAPAVSAAPATQPEPAVSQPATIATTTTATASAATTSTMPASAMSNTLTQNLINMLSNPVTSAYQSQAGGGQPQPSTSRGGGGGVGHQQHENNVSLADGFFAEDDDEDDDDDDDDEGDSDAEPGSSSSTTDRPATTDVASSSSGSASASSSSTAGGAVAAETVAIAPSMARIFVDNVLADPNTCPAGQAAVGDKATTAGSVETTTSGAVGDPETSSLDSLGSSSGAVFQSEPIIIPRPHTNRSSARERAPSKRRPPPTIKPMPTPPPPASVAIVVATDPTTPATPAAVKPTSTSVPTDSASNITIIQVSSPLIKPSTAGDAFQFPSVATAPSTASKIEQADDQYKSNVQIIPSNPVPTHQPPASSVAADTSIAMPVVVATQPQPVTTVQVTTGAVGYGKLKRVTHEPSPPPCSAVSNATTTTTICAASVTTTTMVGSSFGGAVTHIPIGSAVSASTVANNSSQQYEPLFVPQAQPQPLPAGSPKPVPKQRTIGTPSRRPTRTAATTATTVTVSGPSTSSASSNNNHIPSAAAAVATSTASASTTTPAASSSSTGNKLVSTMRENLSSPLPAIRKLLTRGLTDVSITRPSRSREQQAPPPSSSAAHAAAPSGPPSAATNAKPPGREGARGARPAAAGPAAALANETSGEQQRRRSSSHSEAQRGAGRTPGHPTRAAHNNHHNNNNNNNEAPPQQRPLVPKHWAPNVQGGGGVGGGSANSRMTLREQQVMELRKEMMHMGGVRIQLRRKDCQGSIALCDAFGAVWVCGWKQKDHPMLYYALHIGDQVVQVAGVSVGCTADVQRIIRNVQGLYIDIILRRLPFGRVYAIRREMDGQCLGLIRDGNTATIVDVVPKSLSARHGLPPKAQSCDGLSLTFWVLTEINGRPLNLFFKDNEVRDRLNASGRDISVLVQPADLMAKLKKHLKSMRGYKDYIVQ